MITAITGIPWFGTSSGSRLAISGSTLERSDFVHARCWKTLFCCRKYIRPCEMNRRRRELWIQLSCYENWVRCHVTLHNKRTYLRHKDIFPKIFFRFFPVDLNFESLYLLEEWEFRKKNCTMPLDSRLTIILSEKLRNFFLGLEAL